MRDRVREEGKWRKRGWKWAVMLSGHGCNSPVACPDWTGLGPACTGNVCEVRPNPWELQDTWTPPPSPSLFPQRHHCHPKHSKQGGQGGLCQARLTSPGLHTALTPAEPQSPTVQTWYLSLTMAGKSSFRHRTCSHWMYSLQKPI